MAVPQAKFREIVFQLLYSKTHGDPGEKEQLGLMMRELQVTRKTVKQAMERTDAIAEKLETIDPVIAKISTSFAFERIHAVEKTILRLSCYELLFDENIPPKVAITEAMRLARKYSTADASRFVNALLDAIYKQSEGEELDQSELEESAAAFSESVEIAEKLQKEAVNDESGGEPSP